MNELNESVANIYENLIDQEYQELNTDITQLITKLRHMKDNLQDEF